MRSSFKWASFCLLVLTVSSGLDASCARALHFARSANLNGPVASGEKILDLARALSLPYIAHVESAIESIKTQDMVLPRAYPRSFYHFGDFSLDLNREASSDTSGEDNIFDLILAEQRLHRKKCLDESAPLVSWGLRASFLSFVLARQHGIRVLMDGNAEKVYRQQVSPRSDETGALRKTLAASKLNEALGIHTVPRARQVRLARFTSLFSPIQLSIESEWSPGESLLGRSDLILPQGKRSESEAFEFLIGNVDVVERNMTYDVNAGVFVFDHNFAFIAGFIPSNPDLLWGYSLPHCYTPTFAAGLRSLTPKKIVELLAPLLSYQELLWVIFRREILASHLESLGAQAFCDR